jgi:hypothetical protein
MDEQPNSSVASLGEKPGSVTATRTNRWGITRISGDILSTKYPLSKITVSREMGAQNCIEEATDDAVNSYLKTLQDMKNDLMKTTSMIFKSTCIKMAEKKNIRNENGNKITSWNEIGKQFIYNPSWTLAEDIYHVVYTSIDNIHDFKKQVESTWLNMYGIEYTGSIPAGRCVTGLQSLVSVKINMMRKDLMKKLSKVHGFKVINSIKSRNGETAQRRRKNGFNPAYVVNDKNSNVLTFDEYLRATQGNSYEVYSAESTIIDVDQLHNVSIDNREQVSTQVSTMYTHEREGEKKTVESYKTPDTLVLAMENSGEHDEDKSQKKHGICLKMLKESRKLQSIKLELEDKVHELKRLQAENDMTKVIVEMRQRKNAHTKTNKAIKTSMSKKTQGDKAPLVLEKVCFLGIKCTIK